ncbi:MAG: biotin--[acetyl-CoA-carboxylase] ligase [Acidobacteria bacterium]|nr:biotin--[acetyl-CoA-carboxylase] ligase [Acidobacteriota bacterium]
MMPKRRPPLASTDRRVDKLLGLLIEHPMVVLSGAKIARQVGVSRSAVWHWVEKLRALGVRIKGHPKTGYQLERVPDILVPQLLRLRLEGTAFARRIHHFFKIHSTNDVTLELAAAGEPHGALVLAEEQTAGRGRLGRAWYSEKTTGIYLSVLLRPQLAPQQAPLLTLLAGLAVRDAAVEVTGLAVDLRWPNDLLVGGKKFCGILTEMQAEADRIRHVVVGIGVNVNHSRIPSELEAIATSLRLAGGRAFSRLEILVRLLHALDHHYNQLLREGAAPLIARFSEVSSFARGKRVRVAMPSEEISGVTAGLDSTGCLLVRRDADGETVPVLAGDVTEA